MFGHIFTIMLKKKYFVCYSTTFEMKFFFPAKIPARTPGNVLVAPLLPGIVYRFVLALLGFIELQQLLCR